VPDVLVKAHQPDFRLGHKAEETDHSRASATGGHECLPETDAEAEQPYKGGEANEPGLCSVRTGKSKQELYITKVVS